MAKLVLDAIDNLSGQPATAQVVLNNNFDLIEAQVDLLLSRDGEAPNPMLAALDMNSFRIINLGAPVLPEDAVRLRDLTDIVFGGPVPLTILQGLAPSITFIETDATPNEGHWRILVNGDQFQILPLSDLDIPGPSFFTAARNGNVVDNLTITLSNQILVDSSSALYRSDATTIGRNGSSTTNVLGSLFINGVPFGGVSTNTVNQFTATQATTPVFYADSGTITLDLSASNNFYGTINGNRTFAFINPVNGAHYEIEISQGGVGGFTPVFPGTIFWAGNTYPSFMTVTGGRDLVRLTYFQAAGFYFGEVLSLQNSVGSTTNIAIQGSHVNLDLFRMAGAPGSPVTVNLSISTGTVISSDTTASPALDLNGFVAGSVINITNLGVVAGAGGEGGTGGVSSGLSGNDAYGENGRAGEPGGIAIRNAGAGVTVNITNANGRLLGGGGGGGGGGATSSTNVNNLAAGGGGGGGAGGGRRGQGASIRSDNSNVATGANGISGSKGFSGTFGTGGAGAQVGAASGGAGGNGGAYGSPGSAGASPTTQPMDSAGGAAGAAGKAIELNGGAVNFISGSGAPNVQGAVS